MDVQLPGMNGIAALQKIREHAALKAVPVIAVSASVMPDDHRSIVNSGFDAFLTKPIALKTLRATVERFLKQRPAR
jgi:two-component system cell cycle response regulator DivK